MTQLVEPPARAYMEPPDFQEAWQMVISQLRMEMKRSDYEAWVQSLRPLGYKEGVYRVSATNSYARDWAESRLRTRITRLLESIFGQEVTVRFSLGRGGGEMKSLPLAVLEPEAHPPASSAGDAEESGAGADALGEGESASSRQRAARRAPKEDALQPEGGSPRKIQLQRAYGTERARVVQPERGMFLTKYFFAHWLPLLGHSAMTTVLAARSLCYWNPLNGDLRNTVETDMSELARLASVSVRTVKDVLNNELVKRYFLRYKVRRIMTANGVRTAGIRLQVRMDDPLTPEDQDQHHLPEPERWYTADFEDESEE